MTALPSLSWRIANSQLRDEIISAILRAAKPSPTGKSQDMSTQNLTQSFNYRSLLRLLLLLPCLLLLKSTAIANPADSGQPANNGTFKTTYVDPPQAEISILNSFGKSITTASPCEAPCIENDTIYLPPSMSINDFGNAEWLQAVTTIRKDGSAGFSLGPITIGAKKSSSTARLTKTLGLYRVISGMLNTVQLDQDGDIIYENGKPKIGPEFAEVYFGAGVEMNVDIYARSGSASFGASLASIAAQASVGNVNASARFRVIAVMNEEVNKFLPEGIDVTVENLPKITKAFDDMKRTIYKPDPTTTTTVEELQKLLESASQAFESAASRSKTADDAAAAAAAAAAKFETDEKQKNPLLEETARKAAETAAQFKQELANAQNKLAGASRAYDVALRGGVGTLGDRFIKPEVLWIRFPHRPTPSGK